MDFAPPPLIWPDYQFRDVLFVWSDKTMRQDPIQYISSILGTALRCVRKGYPGAARVALSGLRHHHQAVFCLLTLLFAGKFTQQQLALHINIIQPLQRSFVSFCPRATTRTLIKSFVFTQKLKATRCLLQMASLSQTDSLYSDPRKCMNLMISGVR